jgi:integrase
MIKLNTLCTQYLTEQWWLSDSTKQITERAFRYLTMTVGDLLLDHVTYQHGEQLKGWLLKYGSSKNTINMYLRALKPVFTWAIRNKMLTANPFQECKQLKVTQKPIRIYSDYELYQFLRFAPNDRWRAILLTARTTGLRRGELLNLTNENIRDGYIFVEPKTNTDRTWEWEPKDREIRSVPLIDGVKKLIDRLGCVYPFLSKRRYENLLKLKESGFLTGRMRGCPYENFRRDFVTIQRKAFGRQIGNFHSFRKTYITEMVSKLPDYFVARLSGHSNVKTLTTYYTAVKDEQYERARQIVTESMAGIC